MKTSITGLTILLSALFNTCTAQSSHLHYLITGTYTSGKSEGIYVFEFNSQDGSYKEISHVQSSNPSFVAVSPDERFVYAVNESGDKQKGGQVSSFSFNKKTGTLTPVNSQSSGGNGTCYLQVDKTGKWVVVGNYGSGTLAVLPIDGSGKLGAPVTTIQHEGTGGNKRQATPHVHCTLLSKDNKWLLVPDLGIDKVMIYGFDSKNGKLNPAPQPFFKAVGGAGPRHITFHPNNKFAYLIEEISGYVDAFQYSNGKLSAIQRIASVQANDTGFIGSADIHVSADGKFLYASNRGGFNTIAIFAINEKDGTLSLVGHQPSLGKIPRNFSIDPTGDYLLAANQESDDIVIFKRDKTTGLLSDTGNRIDVGKPVCLKWIGK